MSGAYTTLLTERFLASVTPPPLHTLVGILLYDFVTGSSELLPAHKEGLNRHVIPFLDPDGPPTSVWIGGLASRRGSEAINIPLARRRALAAEGHLIHFRPELVMPLSRHGLVATSFGERMSTTHTENSEFYRSALVILSRFAPPPSPPPVRTPPPLQTIFNHFRVRAYGLQIDGGELVAFGSYGFEIDYDISFPNSPPSNPVVYRLRGMGGGGGLPFGGQWADLNSPWNAFTSPFVTDTSGFAGNGRLTTMGGQLGSRGASTTVLTLMPSATSESLRIEGFQSSGRGLGLGGASITGRFERIGPH